MIPQFLQSREELRGQYIYICVCVCVLKFHSIYMYAFLLAQLLCILPYTLKLTHTTQMLAWHLSNDTLWPAPRCQVHRGAKQAAKERAEGTGERDRKHS